MVVWDGRLEKRGRLLDRLGKGPKLDGENKVASFGGSRGIFASDVTRDKGRVRAAGRRAYPSARGGKRLSTRGREKKRILADAGNR